VTDFVVLFQLVRSSVVQVVPGCIMKKKVCINIFVGKGCAAMIVVVKWYDSVMTAVGLLQSVSILLSLCLWITILVVRVILSEAGLDLGLELSTCIG